MQENEPGVFTHLNWHRNSEKLHSSRSKWNKRYNSSKQKPSQRDEDGGLDASVRSSSVCSGPTPLIHHMNVQSAMETLSSI